MKNKLFLIFGILLFGIGLINSAYYVSNPTNCPSTDSVTYPGQDCSPNDICGDISGIAQCADTILVNPPTSSATSNTAYNSSLNGGYVVDCYRTTTCNYGYCNRNSTCYTTKLRDTTCTANQWVASTCGSCRTGYLDCSGDDICETQIGTTTYTQPHTTYLTCSSGQCSSGYVNCTNNLETGGCNEQIGVTTCSEGGVPGTYNSTCGCSPLAQQSFSTNTLATGYGNYLLWGNQTNPLGWLINLFNVNSWFHVDESGNVSTSGNITANYYFGNGTYLTGISGGNSSWNESYADTKYILQSNESNLNVNSSSYSNSTTWWSNVYSWLSGWFNNNNGTLEFNETKLNGTYRPLTNNTFNGDLMANNNTLFVDSTDYSVGIGTNDTTGMLDVANGITNTSGVGQSVNIEGYISNPYLSVGEYQNLLLQTEAFATTWTSSGITITTNGAISPIGTQIAENLNSSSSSANIRQNIVNATIGNWTFSVWLKTQGDASSFAGLQINSSSQAGLIKNVTLTSTWKRYSVTQNFTSAHTSKYVIINTWGNNISVWGAQLEPSLYARPYSGARTTTALPALTRGITTPGAITAGTLTTTGAITGVGVAVGGALSGATSGAFSTTVTVGSTFTGSNSVTSSRADIRRISTDGLVNLESTASNATSSVQYSPRLRWTGYAWDGTASRNMSWIAELIPSNGTSPTGDLVFSYDLNGSGYAEKVRFFGTGNINNSGNITANYFIGSWNGSSDYYLATNPFSFYNSTSLPASTETFWNENFSLYNSSWSSTYNSTYNTWAYNQTTPAVNTIVGFGYYNSTSFDINNYYLNTNPFSFYNSSTWNNPYTYWNSTFATFNKTYADTIYATLAEPKAYNGTLMYAANWNATNTSYYLNTNPFSFYNSTNPSPETLWSANYSQLNNSWASTYNSTYNTWAYNQTTPAINTIVGYGYYNSSTWNNPYAYYNTSNNFDWNNTRSYYNSTLWNNPFTYLNSTNFANFNKVYLNTTNQFSYFNSTSFGNYANVYLNTTNQFNYYNTSNNFDWNNTKSYWNSTFATFNKTYADTIYANVTYFYTNATTFNTFAGYNAGNNTKTYGTNIGYQAGYQNTGDYSTFLGFVAGYQNTMGSVTAIGVDAGYQNTGLALTSLGRYAGEANSGEYVTALGYQAGETGTADDSVYLGFQAGYGNSLNNQFIVRQQNVNTNALITGDFGTGLVDTILGPFDTNFREQDTSATIFTNDSTVQSSNTGSVPVLTLPPCNSTTKGNTYTFHRKSIPSGDNNIKIQRAGSDTIEYSNSYILLTAQGSSVTVQCTGVSGGNSWIILSSYGTITVT